MSENLLVEACFAAARKELAKARAAQREALLAAMDMYRGGGRGRRARLDYRRYDRARSAHLAEAQRIRLKIKGLRVIVRDLEAAHNAGGDAALLFKA